MPFTVDLATTPAIKLALHAAKYPAAPVCGVLLGRTEEGGADAGASAGAPSTTTVRVVDAVPLLHAGLGLASMLEVGMCQVRREERAHMHALPFFSSLSHDLNPAHPHHFHSLFLQADAYARSRSLRLVGYYQANERPEDGDLARYGGRAAADAVARAGNDDGPSTSHPPLALVLSGAALGDLVAGKGTAVADLVTLWTRPAGGKGGQWAPAPPSASSLRTPPGLGDLVRAALASGGADALVDFDDHLLDLAADWRNEGLV